MTAQLARSRPRQAQAAHQDSLPTAETLAAMQAYLRNYMIDDAAGSADWDDPETSVETLYQRAGTHAATQFGHDDLDAMRAMLLARISADVMLPKKPGALAVIGAGDIAETHIAAALSQRPFDSLRIYARQPVAATVLAKKFKHLPQSHPEAVSSPEAALHNAEVVILCGATHKPQIDPDWIMSGAHIICALPQTVTSHDLPIEMIARARIIASESPQHIGATADHLVGVSYTKRRVIHLGAMIDRFDPNRSSGTSLMLMSGTDTLAAPVLKALAHARAAA